MAPLRLLKNFRMSPLDLNGLTVCQESILYSMLASSFRTMILNLKDKSTLCHHQISSTTMKNMKLSKFLSQGALDVQRSYNIIFVGKAMGLTMTLGNQWKMFNMLRKR